MKPWNTNIHSWNGKQRRTLGNNEFSILMDLTQDLCRGRERNNSRNTEKCSHFPQALESESVWVYLMCSEWWYGSRMYNKRTRKGKKSQIPICDNSKTELRNLHKINLEMIKLNSNLTAWNTTFFRKNNVSTCTLSPWMSGSGSITSQYHLTSD